jgi:hypothetical protein
LIPPETQSALDLRMLEYLYDSTQDGSAGVGIGELVKHHGDEQLCLEWLVSARHRGLISKGQRLYPDYRVTSEGRRVVEDVRARRADRGLRRRVLADRLLGWIDSASESVGDATARPDRFLESTASVADGVPFTIEQVRESVDFLVSHGLVKSHVSSWGASHVIVSITHYGRACVDAGEGVAAGVRRQQAPAQHFNIKADGANFAIATGEGGAAQVHATDINVDAVLAVAQTIEEALPALQLGDEAKEFLADLRDTRDPSKVRRALAWFGRMATDSGSGALGSMLGAMALAALGGS